MTPFVRFLIVGAANTGWGYLLIFSFMYFLGWAPELSNAAGYAIAFGTAFLFHRGYTFQSDGHLAGEFGRYCAVFAVAFAVNLAALYAMVRILDWNPYVGQVVAGAVYVGISFSLNRRLVFIRRQNEAVPVGTASAAGPGQLVEDPPSERSADQPH